MSFSPENVKKRFLALSSSLSDTFSIRNSVPTKFVDSGGEIYACKVMISSKPCFVDFPKCIMPFLDLIITLDFFLSNVAKASFNPIPNFPITWGFFNFSSFSF